MWCRHVGSDSEARLLLAAFFVVFLLSFLQSSLSAKKDSSKFKEYVVGGTSDTFSAVTPSGNTVQLKAGNIVSLTLAVSDVGIAYSAAQEKFISSTTLIISGFNNNRNYFLRQDGFPLGKIRSSSSGEIEISQDVSTNHTVVVSAHKGSVYIKADGSVDPSTAPIAVNGNIYTLTGNLNTSLILQKDGITIDGAGFAIMQDTSAPPEFAGIEVSNRKGITIKDLRLENFNWGVFISAANSAVEDSTFTNLSQSYIFIRPAIPNTCNLSFPGIFPAETNDEWAGYETCNIVRGNIFQTNPASSSGQPVQVSMAGSYFDEVYGNIIVSTSNAWADAIWLNSSDKNYIHNNELRSSYWGLILQTSLNNSVAGSTIAAQYGIEFNSDRGDNRFTNNLFEPISAYYPVYAMGFNDGPGGGDIIGNNVFDDANLFPSWHATNITLNGNTFSNSVLTIQSGGKVTVSSNAFDASNITVTGSSDLTINDNSFLNVDGQPVILSNSKNVQILRNQFSQNVGTGIQLANNSSSVTIAANDFQSNGGAVSLSNSYANTISSNTFRNNYNGITLEGASYSNSFYHNNMADTPPINYLDSGRLIYGTTEVLVLTQSQNSWNLPYPAGGNYWSGHTGPNNYSGPGQNERLPDSFVDIPEVLGPNNQDNYPFVSENGWLYIDTVPPAAVSDLAVATAAESSLTLQWTSPADTGIIGFAKEYEIRYSTRSPFYFSLAAPIPYPPYPEPAGTISTFTVTGLVPGTTYYFALESADVMGNVSALSNVAQGLTLPDHTPPDPVTDLQAGYNSVKQTNPAVLEPKDSDVFLRWTRPFDLSGVYSYRIFRSTAPGVTGGAIAAISINQLDESVRTLLGGEDYFTDAGVSLPAGATFYYTVQPVDRGNNVQTAGDNQSSGIVIDHQPPVVSAAPEPAAAFFQDPDDQTMLLTRRMPAALEAGFDFTGASDSGGSGGIYSINLVVNGSTYPLSSGTTYYQVHSDTGSLGDADSGESREGCLMFSAMDNAGNWGYSPQQCITWDGSPPWFDLSFSPDPAGAGQTVTATLSLIEPVLIAPEVSIRQSGLTSGTTIAMTPDPADPYHTFIGTYSVLNGYDGYAVGIGSATDIVGNVTSAADWGYGFTVNTGNPIYDARTDLYENESWNPVNSGPVDISVSLTRTLDLELEILSTNPDGSLSQVLVSTFTNQSSQADFYWDGNLGGNPAGDGVYVYKWTAFEPGTGFSTAAVVGVPLEGDILLAAGISLNFTNVYPVNSEVMIMPVIDKEANDKALTDGGTPVGAIYDIQPDSAYFDPPAALTICYPSGTTGTGIYSYTDTTWSLLSSCPSGCCTVQLTHLCEYALLKPAPKQVNISLELAPDTLNLKSQGKYVTAYIEASGAEASADIKPETVEIVSMDDVRLSTPLPIVSATAGNSGSLKFAEIGDYNSNGIPDLMVKFDRAALIGLLKPDEQAKLTLEGVFMDSSTFSVDGYIRAILPGNISAAAGGDLALPTKAGVRVPPGALDADKELTVVELAAVRKSSAAAENAAAGRQSLKLLGHDFEFGPEGTRFNSPVRITLPVYPGEASGAPAASLAIAWWDPRANAWLPLDSAVSASGDAISAETSHFSVYRVVSAPGYPQSSADPAFRLGEVYVYPDPARGGAVPTFHIEAGLADRVEIYIYNVAGELVHKAALSGAPQVIDDGQGPQYAYEYQWNGRIPSGVYLYLVKARKSGYGGLKKTGRFAVVR